MSSAYEEERISLRPSGRPVETARVLIDLQKNVYTSTRYVCTNMIRAIYIYNQIRITIYSTLRPHRGKAAWISGLWRAGRLTLLSSLPPPLPPNVVAPRDIQKSHLKAPPASRIRLEDPSGSSRAAGANVTPESSEPCRPKDSRAHLTRHVRR